MVEQGIVNPKVEGSSPSLAANSDYVIVNGIAVPPTVEAPIFKTKVVGFTVSK